MEGSRLVGIADLTRCWTALRHRLLLGCLLVGCFLLAGGVQAQDFTPWSTRLPEMEAAEYDQVVKDVRGSYSDGILVYKVRDITYLFTPPETLGSRTLEQVAQQMVTTLAGAGAFTGKPQSLTVQSGQNVLLFIAFKNPAGTRQKQVYAFFEGQGQWGALIMLFSPGMSDDEDAEEEAGAVLAQTQFSPTPLDRLVSPAVTSRLSAVPWPQLRPDRVVSTAPKVSFPQALKLGLNPQRTPLPDTFDCYRNTTTAYPLRPMTATPDARLSFRKGTYEYATGAETSSGRWNAVTNKNYIALDGVLSDETVYIYARDSGQIISMDGPDGPMTCFQAGPAAQFLRLDMQKAYASGEQWTCVDGSGEVASLKLNLAGSTYTHARGTGRLIAGYTLDGAQVRSSLTFRQGPFHLLTASIQEDDFGNREMRLTRSMEFGGAFHTERKSATIAQCSVKTTPKPRPLYGPNKAPSTGYKGGLNGLYLWPRTVSYMSGMLLLYQMNWAVTLFTPDGYMKDDLESESGELPDCTRTLPNGSPVCQRYELKGNTIRQQDEDGVWETQPFVKNGTTLKIADDFAYPLPAVKGALSGIYTSDNLEGTNLGVSTGTINSFSNAYQFTPGGQFSWRSSSGGSFSVGAGGFSSDIIASGGSSRTETGQGTYQLSHPWLTLKFAGGPQQRYLAFTLPPALAKTWDDLANAVNIGGTWYKPVKGK